MAGDNHQRPRYLEPEDFTALAVAIDDGVGRVTIPHLGDDDATRGRVHTEIGQVWRLLDDRDDVRAILVTGTGDEFYLSGTPYGSAKQLFGTAGPERIWETTMKLEREVNDIVYGLARCSKPIVSAINGMASGAGLAVALLADISVAASDARFRDPHAILGMAAGDGAAIIMPLLVGLAKTKLFMLTSDILDGTEAERIGLVGRVVAPAELAGTAEGYARRLADGPVAAQRFIKRSLNQWLRLGALVSYDQSFVLQALSFFGPEVRRDYWPADDPQEPRRG
jgi:enoyl-CoA hydratase